ncbi:MAG: SAM-dependent methyltransferase [Treponema sp.]|nr:SAM-dependent methyltransferase [Treponema sp.]
MDAPQKIDAALYLIPVPLGETSVEQVLPSYNHDIVVAIKHFIVEDIRSARRFLKKTDSAIDIDTLTFYELNEHTDLAKISHILDPLEKGEPMGVISEAGCPAVADPGAAAVALAQKKRLPVVPLVGPSSIILSLMASGFNGQSFAFNGYLPVKPAERAAKIRQLENRAYKEDQTQIFIEAPYRNAKMLESLLSACRADTKICVAVGITTAQEYIKTKTVAQWKKEKQPDFQKIPAIFLLYK